MKHFLYAFDEGERDKLLALNYVLVKSDNHNHIYIFENKDNLTFNLKDSKIIESDKLTF